MLRRDNIWRMNVSEMRRLCGMTWREKELEMKTKLVWVALMGGMSRREKLRRFVYVQ